MTEHAHEYQPLFVASLEHNYPDIVVYYHCMKDGCDHGIWEVEKGFEL